MRTIVLPGTAALAAALFLAATLAAAATGKPPTARTESGVVSGVAADGVVSWRGVPSAAPPLGDLRCVREERRRQRRGRGGAPNPAQAARQRARPRAEPDDHGPAARHVRGADGRRAGRRGRGRDGVPRRPAGQGRVPDRGEQPRVRVHGAAGPCGRRHACPLRRREGQGPRGVRPRGDGQQRRGRGRPDQRRRDGRARATDGAARHGGRTADLRVPLLLRRLLHPQEHAGGASRFRCRSCRGRPRASSDSFSAQRAAIASRSR